MMWLGLLWAIDNSLCVLHRLPRTALSNLSDRTNDSSGSSIPSTESPLVHTSQSAEVSN